LPDAKNDTKKDIKEDDSDSDLELELDDDNADDYDDEIQKNKQMKEISEFNEGLPESLRKKHEMINKLLKTKSTKDIKKGY